MEYKMLFKSIKINNMVIPNRSSMPPMHLHFTPGGEMTEEFIAFYRERAIGEVGLITVGGCTIDDTAGGPLFVGLEDDKFIPGLKKFTGEIHKVSETKVAAQLYHAGRYSFSMLIGKQPVAPSPIASKFTGEVPKELTVEEIRQLEDDFANAAYRAKISGFDAVEILGSAGYIIPQFLSPLTNIRTDEYGGSLENRVRFGVEVIQKTREAVGSDYPLIIRQGGSDFIKGGNTSKDILGIVKFFADAGIDLFNVTGGWHETRVPQITGSVPKAAFSYLATGIRKASGKPVIISNRLSTPEIGEELLRKGLGDLVNFGRPLIADPYLIKKAKEKQEENITPCISCNQMCFDAVFRGEPVGCTVNPLAGKESKIKIEKAEKKKKLVVIGAGPGGLEAAITAASRGHDVTVFEKKEEIGGQIEVAAAPPDKKDFYNLIPYYKNQIKRYNINLKTGIEPTKDDILKENPDMVVISTGGTPITPPFKGVDLPIVVSAEEVLKGDAILGERIVVIGGGAVGVDVSVTLAEVGKISGDTTKFLLEFEAEDCERLTELVTKGSKEITIIEMLDKIGKDIGKSTRWVALSVLRKAEVKMLTRTKALEIQEDGILVENEKEGQFKIPADTIVIAVGYKPNNALYEDLKETFDGKIEIIGDAKKVRKLPDAIQEGFEIGIKL